MYKKISTNEVKMKESTLIQGSESDHQTTNLL